jgi:thiamine-monophosphate kinase
VCVKYLKSGMDLEENIIEQFRNKTINSVPAGWHGIGDDCSLMPINSSCFQATTTDLLIENVHFKTDWISSDELAYKSLIVNLSDLNAMGAKPDSVHLSLGVPRKISRKYLNDFIDSFTKYCQQFSLCLLGGDTVYSPNDLVINLVVSGKVEKTKVKFRSGAQVNDKVCVIGSLGESRLGLHLLENNISHNLKDYFLNRHHRPLVDLETGPWLSQFESVTSLTDISDGLYLDLQKIMKSSSVGSNLYLEKINVSDNLKIICKDLDVSERLNCLFGGEDYGLLFTVKASEEEKVLSQLKAKFNVTVSSVGEITSNENKLHIFENGIKKNIKDSSFKHFL